MHFLSFLHKKYIDIKIVILYNVYMNHVIYSKKAQKQLRSLSVKMRTRIDERCETYGSDPVKYQNWCVSIANTAYHRLRVGKIRIVFEHQQQGIFVSKIESRGSVYDRI